VRSRKPGGAGPLGNAGRLLFFSPWEVTSRTPQGNASRPGTGTIRGIRRTAFTTGSCEVCEKREAPGEAQAGRRYLTMDALRDVEAEAEPAEDGA
jgi:hypothetical protein